MTAVLPPSAPGSVPGRRRSRSWLPPATSPAEGAAPACDVESAQHAAALGEAWRTMRRARTGIVAHVAADTDDIHLEVGDVETLDQIAVRGGLVQMSELAAELQVAPSTTTKAVGRLVDRGLAVRHRDQHDRRVWRVSLTKAGARAHTIARDRRLAFACRVLARFEPADQEEIGRLMPGLAEALGSELRIPIGRWADWESDTSVAAR